MEISISFSENRTLIICLRNGKVNNKWSYSVWIWKVEKSDEGHLRSFMRIAITRFKFLHVFTHSTASFCKTVIFICSPFVHFIQIFFRETQILPALSRFITTITFSQIIRPTEEKRYYKGKMQWYSINGENDCLATSQRSLIFRATT